MEYDPMSGSGRVTLGRDGQLEGVFRIKDGDSSTFIAVRTRDLDEPIPAPASYRDKWRTRWRRGLYFISEYIQEFGQNATPEVLTAGRH